MLAEERTKLLHILWKEGIGTNYVESFHDGQARMKFGARKDKRDIGRILSQMEGKLEDSRELERSVRRDRGRVRSKLEKIMGGRSNQYKKFSNRTRDKIGKE